MKTKDIILVLGVTILLLLAGVVWEIWITSKYKAETIAATASAQSRLGSDVWSRNVKEIQGEFGVETEVLHAAAITRPGLATLVELLESTGKDMGLSVTIVSVKNESDKDPVNKPHNVRITIETRGGWSGSLAFVRLLQSLPHKTMIESTSLSRQEGGWKSSSVIKIVAFPQNS